MSQLRQAQLLHAALVLVHALKWRPDNFNIQHSSCFNKCSAGMLRTQFVPVLFCSMRTHVFREVTTTEHHNDCWL
jgi:hypothetical protein